MVNRVLLVEDDRISREIILRQLNSLGVNCYAVEDAEQAVDLAEFFDLILMDLQLPGISGIDATTRIRTREREKGLQRVAIIATTDSENREQCYAAGMDDHYPKPITRADLERLLNDWVWNQPKRLRLLR